MSDESLALRIRLPHEITHYAVMFKDAPGRAGNALRQLEDELRRIVEEEVAEATVGLRLELSRVRTERNRMFECFILRPATGLRAAPMALGVMTDRGHVVDEEILAVLNEHDKRAMMGLEAGSAAVPPPPSVAPAPPSPAPPSPRYEHSCVNCTYLGPFDHDNGTHYDLYFCNQSSLRPNVLARYSSDGPDYISGLEWELPHIIEARRRAVERGLLEAETADGGESEGPAALPTINWTLADDESRSHVGRLRGMVAGPGRFQMPETDWAAIKWALSQVESAIGGPDGLRRELAEARSKLAAMREGMERLLEDAPR